MFIWGAVLFRGRGLVVLGKGACCFEEGGLLFWGRGACCLEEGGLLFWGRGLAVILRRECCCSEERVQLFLGLLFWRGGCCLAVVLGWGHVHILPREC